MNPSTNGALLALGVVGAVAAAGTVMGGQRGSSAKSFVTLGKMDRIDNALSSAPILLNGEEIGELSVWKTYMGGPIHTGEIGFGWVEVTLWNSDLFPDGEDFSVVRSSKHPDATSAKKSAVAKILSLVGQARGGSMAKEWSSMSASERQKAQRQARAYFARQQQRTSRQRKAQEREPDWSGMWYDTSSELD